MPRPRRLDGLPAHIDPRRIPTGLFWDRSGSGRWMVRDAATGKAQRVAGPEAPLSELHAIAEERASGAQRGTVAHVLEAFHASADFKGLAPRTRDDYERQQTIACAIPTKIGPLGTLVARRLRVPLMQTLLDRIAVDHPTKANHLLRYLRRTFRWGITRGHLDQDPTRAIRQFKERAQRRLPPHQVIDRVREFARTHGQLSPRTPGSCAPYLWLVMELGYLCRLRPVETITLSDAHGTPDGVLTNRRKGSRDSLVRWTPRLRAAWDAAIALRAKAWERKRLPTPIKPEHRYVVVNETGQRLGMSGLHTAWQRLMIQMVAGGLLDTSERFGLHDLKRRGITDTPGRAAKLEAGGHRSEQMLAVYDLEVPAVEPPTETR